MKAILLRFHPRRCINVHPPVVNQRAAGTILPIVAAYMMTLDKRPGESRDHNAIAGMVLQLAREEDIKELPTIDTMKDVISKIFNRADEFSTQQ